MTATAQHMRERLAVLDASAIEIIDESHLHAGHAGAKGGGGHYRLHIVAPRFTGCTTMQRHRLVYDSLGSLMKQEIHALSIIAQTPDEAGSH
jgi:BolA protein